MPLRDRAPASAAGAATKSPTPTTGRLFGIFITAWVLLSGLSIGWAVATPLAAAPDEPAHIVKAASVALGEFSGEFGPDGTVVDVPQYAAWTHAQSCTAFNDTVSADCQTEAPGDPGRIVASATTAGLYNPLYYALVGWPALVDGDSSGVYAMRIMSAVLSSAFFALAVMMVATWRRRALPLMALGAAATPMVLFLAGTVNPNPLEITAVLAAFIAVLSVVIEPNPALLTQRTVIAAVAGVVAANMRGLSPAWVAVAVLAPLLLADRMQLRALLRSWRVRIAALAIVAGAAFATVWVLTSNSLASHVDPANSATVIPYYGASPIVGFGLMLLRLGGQLREMVGIFGWMDTAAPIEAYILWTLLIGGLVIGALLLARGKQRLFVVALSAALVIVPALAQAAFIRGGGFIWQGRYTLPLLVILILGCAAVLAARFAAVERGVARPLIIGMWTAWALAQAYTFVIVLHRYAVGSDGSWSDLLTGPDWAPPGGVPLCIGGFLLVLIASTAWAARATLRSRDAEAAAPR